MRKFAKHLRRPAAGPLLAAAVAAATACVFAADGCRGDAAVVASFVGIIAIGAWGMVSDPRPLGLRQMFFLFITVFMGLAPLSQYLAGVTLWEPAPFTAAQYLRANALVALCCGAFALGCHLSARRFRPRPEPQDIPKVSAWRLMALSAAAVLVTVAYYRSCPGALVLRKDFELFILGESVPRILIINYVLRSVPMMCLLVALSGRGAARWQTAALAVLAVAAAMPTALPRQQVAALYIPAALLAVPWLRGDKRLTLCLFVALLLLFPAMTALRGSAVEGLHSVDFDSYMLLCRLVDRGYTTGGEQLLGTLLFFVPRALWAAKPVASGYWMCYAENYANDNLSMPLLGEGFLNFGWEGALGFALAAGLGAGWMDTRIAGMRAGGRAAALVVLGYAMFLLRGPLMSAFGMLCSTLAALAGAWVAGSPRSAKKGGSAPREIKKNVKNGG